MYLALTLVMSAEPKLAQRPSKKVQCCRILSRRLLEKGGDHSPKTGIDSSAAWGRVSIEDGFFGGRTNFRLMTLHDGVIEDVRLYRKGP
jgi:hypothetical protein